MRSPIARSGAPIDEEGLRKEPPFVHALQLALVSGDAAAPAPESKMSRATPGSVIAAIVSDMNKPRATKPDMWEAKASARRYLRG